MAVFEMSIADKSQEFSSTPAVIQFTLSRFKIFPGQRPFHLKN